MSTGRLSEILGKLSTERLEDLCDKIRARKEDDSILKHMNQLLIDGFMLEMEDRRREKKQVPVCMHCRGETVHFLISPPILGQIMVMSRVCKLRSQPGHLSEQEIAACEQELRDNPTEYIEKHPEMVSKQ